MFRLNPEFLKLPKSALQNKTIWYSNSFSVKSTGLIFWRKVSSKNVYYKSKKMRNCHYCSLRWNLDSSEFPKRNNPYLSHNLSINVVFLHDYGLDILNQGYSRQLSKSAILFDLFESWFCPFQPIFVRPEISKVAISFDWSRVSNSCFAITAELILSLIVSIPCLLLSQAYCLEKLSIHFFAMGSWFLFPDFFGKVFKFD